MGQYLSAQEVKVEILYTFPGNSGKLFYQLWNNVALLHWTWENYRSLFGTSPERVELLNWIASSFFGQLDNILLNDVVMRIARLSDPSKSVGRENASLARLIDEISPHEEATFINELRCNLKSFLDYCEPIRQLRNRILAHEDLATALEYHPDPLPGISRTFIEGALEKIRDLVGTIEQRFRGSHTSFQHTFSTSDAESLVFALKGAQEHEECRKREFKKKYGIADSDE